MQKVTLGWLEKLADGVDASRRVFGNFGKLVFIMSKGAYLIQERRKLYEELGRQCHQLQVESKTATPELDGIVRTIDRLTKKIELEEVLIRQYRFGARPRRPSRKSDDKKDVIEAQ